MMNARRKTLGPVVLLMLGTLPARATAQAVHARHDDTGLLKVVRESTERFRDVETAEVEGYGLQFGCVSGPDAGASASLREPESLRCRRFIPLHVWAWKESPAGALVNWHPNISCNAFKPQPN